MLRVLCGHSIYSVIFNISKIQLQLIQSRCVSILTVSGKNMSNIPDEVEKYGEALIRAWEQYLKIIDILIALAGATALIMVNVLNGLEKESLHSLLAVSTIITYAASLFMLAFWRFAAQHFYEYETIGSPRIAKKYFTYHGIENPISQSFKPQPYKRPFYRAIYKVVSHCSGLLLAISWVLCVLLIASPLTHPSSGTPSGAPYVKR